MKELRLPADTKSIEEAMDFVVTSARAGQDRRQGDGMVSAHYRSCNRCGRGDIFPV